MNFFKPLYMSYISIIVEAHFFRKCYWIYNCCFKEYVSHRNPIAQLQIAYATHLYYSEIISALRLSYLMCKMGVMTFI